MSRVLRPTMLPSGDPAEAVMAVRGAYAQLEIPKESWVVSPRFVAGAEKSVFEPDAVRAYKLLVDAAVGSAMTTRLAQWLPSIAC